MNWSSRISNIICKAIAGKHSSPMHPSFASFPFRKVLVRVFALITLALTAPLPCSAGSCKLIVVRSGDLKPYQDVIKGIKESSFCSVQEMPLRGHDGQEKILQKSPDIIVAIGTAAFKKVRAIDSVPVVYTMSIPSEVDPFKKPNISGVDIDVAPAGSLATIRELFPGVKRIGILYDPVNTAFFVQEAAKVARDAGIELVLREVRDSSKIASGLDEMRQGIDLFWMLPDATVVTGENVELLLRFSFEKSVPIFTFSKKYVEMGAAAAADMDPYDIGAQAGEIANRLLSVNQKSIREFARTSHVTVNTNVIRKMGIKIKKETLGKVEELE